MKDNNSGSFQHDLNGEYVYFSHIPKTAGTSFTAILDRFFTIEETLPSQLWYEIGDVEKVRQKAYRLIRGHFGAAGHILSQEKLNVFTILRNPISLAYSTYQHVKRDKNTNVHQYVKDKDLTFEAFVVDQRTQNLVKNRLIKSLSFGLNLEKPANLIVDKENYRANRTAWNQYRKSLSTSELLQTMKAYLDRCGWFGIQEQFDLSLNLLCLKMGWPPIGKTNKLNINHKVESISDEALGALKELNSLDFEFYEYAKQKFDQRVCQMYQDLGVSPGADEEVQQLIDENYQITYPVMNEVNKSKQINFDCSQVLLGQNWHDREWSELEQSYFRWTGPTNRTSIDFWVQKTDYHVSISYINIIDQSLLETLSVNINGVEVNISVNHCENRGKIAFLCKRELITNDGLLRLTINMDNLHAHDHIFGSQDLRVVGLAVNKIEIVKTGI